MIETAACSDTAVFVAFGADQRPLSRARRRRRCAPRPRLDGSDQIQLPDAPLELPDAECCGGSHDDRQQRGEERSFVEPTLRRQGMSVMSTPCVGIMLAFIWYIAHTEPPIVMTT